MPQPPHPYVDQLLDFYAWVAPVYDVSAGGAHDRAADAVAEMAAAAPHEFALDIGCGTGLVTHRLGAAPSFGGQAVGVDISQPMLDVARAGRPAGSTAAFAFMDANELTMRDGSVDVVTLGQVIGYVPDPERVLGEAHRVLRRGGRIVVSSQRRMLCTPAEELFFRILDEMAANFRIPRLPAHHALFGEPWVLTELLAQAGFAHVRTTQLLIGNHTANSHDWVDLMLQSGPYPHACLSLLQPAGRARFEQRVETAMRELGDSAFTYHRAYTFATAQRL
jgi:demethylmenaquinone methyltransferase/2-methoxy-6-polyprenyl-1,4-benzoquinol methylase